MAISSRTPEGEPHRCPICGEVAAVEPSYPGGDSCCPACGALLWRIRDHLASALNLDPQQISPDADWEQLGLDSLAMVELVMELEETYNIEVPDDVAERIQTPADFIRYLIARGYFR